MAFNPRRQQLDKRLREAGVDLTTIEALHERAIALTGKPEKIRFTDKPVAVVRYRDGSVIDTVYQVAD